MEELTREEQAARQRQIGNQWREFSKTEAYKQYRDYIAMQNEFAIAGAKGPVMPFDEENGQQFIFDGQKAAALLQRSVGYDIVTTYVDGYIDLSA
jgi:hypothetical protein